MPRKLYDDDGKEIEVLTDEEVKDLKTKAEAGGKAEEYTKLVNDVRSALGVGKDANVLEAIKEAKDSSNPNWKLARGKIDRLTTFIKSKIQGAEIDDEGNVKATEATMTPEQIRSEVASATKKEMLGAYINQKLSKMPDDKRTVVQKYYQKLTTGEEVTLENVDKFIGEAINIVIPKGSAFFPQFGGNDPVITDEHKEDFAATEAGKTAGKFMGLRSTAEEAKK